MQSVNRSRSRLIFVTTVLSMAGVIVACGGGGSATSAPITVTCPNGASRTAATLELATAQCAAPTLVSVSPANASTFVAVDTFKSVDVVTDSTLDASSITATNVTLKAGVNAVAGAASAVGTKGFKFAPTAPLNFAQAYAFSATVKDTLGRSLVVSSGFTTAAIACILPLVPDASATSCVPLTATTRYSSVGNYAITECVKDNLTGLTWEGKPTSGLRTSTAVYTNYGDNRVGDASAYPAAVNGTALCGYTDWRLPTLFELERLIDFTGEASSRKINITWFPNTQRSYWSSTIDPGLSYYIVDFVNGSYPLSALFPSLLISVRLVR